MNNTVDMWVGSEDLIEGSFIAYVNVVEMRSLSANQSAMKFRVSKTSIQLILTIRYFDECLARLFD